MSFGQNVVARLGTSELSCERLFVEFMTPGKDKTKDLLKDARQKEEQAAAGGAEKPTSQETSQEAGTESEDLRITWDGPMEMRPQDEQDVTLVDEKDRVLLAEGTKDRAVKVIDRTRDGVREITAAKLRYHKSKDSVELESDTYHNVRVKDPLMGELMARQMRYVLHADKADKLYLAGPGRMDVPQSVLHKEKAGTAGPVVVSWEKMMEVDVVRGVGGNGGEKEKWSIKHALLTGDVWVRNPGLTGIGDAYELNADTLDLRLTQMNATKVALEHMTATAAKIRAARQRAAFNVLPQGLAADKLDVSTIAGVPSKMVAVGNVVAWTYGDQSDFSKELGGAAKKTELDKQTLYASKMEAVLEPKEKGEKEDVELGTNTRVKSMTATDGVKVELEGIGAVVTARSLVADPADPKTGKARLLGDKETPVLITMGDDQITSLEMLFDQKSQSIEIPCAGEFTFVEKKENGEKSAPVRISWSEKMTYDRASRQAQFMGNVGVEMDGKDETTVVSCKEQLKATLADRKAGGREGKLPIEQFQALGDVNVTQTKWDKDENILTRMHMHSEEVRYSESSQLLELPCAGLIGLEDNEVKAKKEGAMDTTGTSTLTWTGNLKFALDTGELTITEGVHMIRVPTKPMPVPAGMGGGEVKRIELFGDTLTAKLLPDPENKNKATLLGGGKPNLDNVKLDGSARLAAGEREVRALYLIYDAVNQIVSAKGTLRQPVQLVRPGVSSPNTPGITYNLLTDELKVEPLQGMIELE